MMVKARQIVIYGKLDWFINDDHSVEFTTIGFTNKGKGESFDNDWETQQVVIQMVPIVLVQAVTL